MALTDYQTIEYIQGVEGAYIDTGYMPNKYTTVSGVFMIDTTSTTDSKYLYGLVDDGGYDYNNGHNYSFRYSVLDNCYYWRHGDTEVDARSMSPVFPSDLVTDFKITKSQFGVNKYSLNISEHDSSESEYSSLNASFEVPTTDQDSTKSMYLLAFNHNGVADNFGVGCRIYYVELVNQNTDEVVFRGYPVRESVDSDYRVGIYDAVSDRVFWSRNADYNFIAGPDVEPPGPGPTPPTPSETYTRVNYVNIEHNSEEDKLILSDFKPEFDEYTYTTTVIDNNTISNEEVTGYKLKEYRFELDFALLGDVTNDSQNVPSGTDAGPIYNYLNRLLIASDNTSLPADLINILSTVNYQYYHRDDDTEDGFIFTDYKNYFESNIKSKATVPADKYVDVAVVDNDLVDLEVGKKYSLVLDITRNPLATWGPSDFSGGGAQIYSVEQEYHPKYILTLTISNKTVEGDDTIISTRFDVGDLSTTFENSPGIELHTYTAEDSESFDYNLRVYGLNIYELNGTSVNLVKEYTPVRRNSDGSYGLFSVLYEESSESSEFDGDSAYYFTNSTVTGPSDTVTYRVDLMNKFTGMIKAYGSGYVGKKSENEYLFEIGDVGVLEALPTDKWRFDYWVTESGEKIYVSRYQFYVDGMEKYLILKCYGTRVGNCILIR